MKRTIGELIEELRKINPLCHYHSYEGEVTGIVFYDPSNTIAGVIHDDKDKPSEIPEAIAERPQVTITLKELRRLCRQFDSDNGSYVEDKWQGKSLYKHFIYTLQSEKRLKD